MARPHFFVVLRRSAVCCLRKNKAELAYATRMRYSPSEELNSITHNILGVVGSSWTNFAESRVASASTHKGTPPSPRA